MSKLFNTFKLFYLLSLIFFISIIYSTKAISIDSLTPGDNFPDACTVSTTGVITITSNDDCTIQPDQQNITFYQVDFCTAAPTAPTTTSNIIKNSCSTFFKNENGAEITVEYQNGTAIGTNSDYSRLPYKTFTHAIITMDAVFKFKSTMNFASASVMDARRVGGAQTTCVTKETNYTGNIRWGFSVFDGSGQDQFDFGTIECGDNLTPQFVSVGINTLGDLESITNNCRSSARFSGTSSFVDVYSVTSNGNLVNGSSGGAGCVNEGAGTISRIVGIVPVTLKVNRRTVGFQVEYNNKNGMLLDFSDFVSTSPFTLISIGTSYFDMSIEAVQRGRAGCSTGDWC